MKSSLIQSILIIAFIVLTNLVIIAQPQTSTDINKGYLIGPGDVIAVKVMGEPTSDFTAIIDDDGMVQVPFYTERIMAKCRTENELKTDVARLMSKYLRNPMVSVAVTDRKSRPPTSVYGEVRQPQGVILVRKTQLLELLAFVGGPTEDAGGMVQVIRSRAAMCSGMGETITANAGNADVPHLYSLSAMRSGNDEANPLVYPGDSVVVLKAAPVYLTGEVRQPQGIRLAETGTSLTQAIAMVGGLSPTARTSNVKVYRQKPGKTSPEVLSADLKLIKAGDQKDIMLEPYDVIEVDKAKDSIGMAILKIAIGAGKAGLGSVTGGLGYRVMY